LHGWQDTAPAAAAAWFERCKFVHEHPAYTYEGYDRADAGDILLDRDFHALLDPLISERHE
jgi:hypothetical protein